MLIQIKLSPRQFAILRHVIKNRRNDYDFLKKLDNRTLFSLLGRKDPILKWGAEMRLRPTHLGIKAYELYVYSHVPLRKHEDEISPSVKKFIKLPHPNHRVISIRRSA